jgi:hypothetical protein
MEEIAPITYTHRPKPYGGGSIFTLGADRLHILQGPVESEMLFADIASITLVYRPRNSTSEGYHATIRNANNHTATVTNLTFRNAMSIDRQDREYHAFMSALIAAAAKANPALVLQAGLPLWMNILSAISGVAALLAMVMLAFNAVVARNFPIALLLGLLGVYFGWWIWRYVMHNRPQRFSADAIPAVVMPPKVQR